MIRIYITQEENLFSLVGELFNPVGETSNELKIV